MEILSRLPRGGRDRSIRFALSKLYENRNKLPANIVETGCIRTTAHLADGGSTLYWKIWAEHTNSSVWTCDIDPRHMDNCKKVVGESDHVSFNVGDSIRFLREFTKPIHLLFLDSYDTNGYRFADKGDYDTSGDEDGTEASNHQLEEVKASIDKFGEKPLVLLDDVYDAKFDGSELYNYDTGKGRFSIPYLIENGFRVINYIDNQVLLEYVQ